MTSVASVLPSAKIETVASTMRRSGFCTLAQVSDTSRTTDLAIAIGPGRLAVARYVVRAAHDDYAALATMISEGDFIWGRWSMNKANRLSLRV